MNKKRIIIPQTGNEHKPLPPIVQILIENQVIKMDNVTEIVAVFRSGQDLSFDINAESITEIEKDLKGLKIIYRID